MVAGVTRLLEEMFYGDKIPIPAISQEDKDVAIRLADWNIAVDIRG